MGEGVVKRGEWREGASAIGGLQEWRAERRRKLQPPPRIALPVSQSAVERNAVTVQSCVTGERLSMQETKKEEVAE